MHERAGIRGWENKTRGIDNSIYPELYCLMKVHSLATLLSKMNPQEIKELAKRTSSDKEIDQRKNGTSWYIIKYNNINSKIIHIICSRCYGRSNFICALTGDQIMPCLGYQAGRFACALSESNGYLVSQVLSTIDARKRVNY